MHICPQCQSDSIHRSRSRNFWETWRKELTKKRVYRCHKCGWRGWGVDLGPKFSDQETEEHEIVIGGVQPRPAIRLDELDKLDRRKK